MSVQFSSHTGYPGFRGRAFDAGMIDECVEGLGSDRRAPACGGLLTGYLGKAEIGEAALRALARDPRRQPGRAWCCDPVIGDVGRGPYVAPEVAEFFRERALPAATPRHPERLRTRMADGDACRATSPRRARGRGAQARGPDVVAVTSLLLDDTPEESIDIVAGDADGLCRARTPRLPIAVNGAGDLFAALFFHHWLDGGLDARGAFARRLVGVRDRGGDAEGGAARTCTHRSPGGIRAPLARCSRPNGSDVARPRERRSFTFSAHRRTKAVESRRKFAARKEMAMPRPFKMCGAAVLRRRGSAFAAEAEAQTVHRHAAHPAARRTADLVHGRNRT